MTETASQPMQNPKSALYELCQKYRLKQPQLIFVVSPEKKGTATLTLTYEDLDTAAANHQMTFTCQAQPKKVAEQQVCRQALEDPGLLALVGVRQVQLQALLEKTKAEKKAKAAAEAGQPKEGLPPKDPSAPRQTSGSFIDTDPDQAKAEIPVDIPAVAVEAPPGAREAIEELNRKCQACQLKADYAWNEITLPNRSKAFSCTLNIGYKDEAAAAGKVPFPSVASKMFYTTKKAAQRDCAKCALAHPAIRASLDAMMAAKVKAKPARFERERKRQPLLQAPYMPQSMYPMPQTIPIDKRVKPKPAGKVVAIYSYGPDIETFDPSCDLAFNTGDVITIVERLDQDWLKGELRGKRGSVPLNFVTPQNQERLPPPRRGESAATNEPRPPLLGQMPWSTSYYGRGEALGNRRALHRRDEVWEADPYRMPNARYPYTESRFPDRYDAAFRLNQNNPYLRSRGFKEWVPGSSAYGPLIPNWYR